MIVMNRLAATSGKRQLEGLILRVLCILSVFCAAIWLSSCAAPRNAQEVVIYASVDQVYAEPVLEQFEKQTGIKALAAYDVEAAKTT